MYVRSGVPNLVQVLHRLRAAPRLAKDPQVTSWALISCQGHGLPREKTSITLLLHLPNPKKLPKSSPTTQPFHPGTPSLPSSSSSRCDVLGHSLCRSLREEATSSLSPGWTRTAMRKLSFPFFGLKRENAVFRPRRPERGGLTPPWFPQQRNGLDGGVARGKLRVEVFRLRFALRPSEAVRFGSLR